MSKIKEIAEKRKALATQKILILGLEDSLSQTTEWMDLNLARAQMLQTAYDLQTIENEYKAKCVEVYTATGEKV